jgi:integrase
MSRPQRIPSYRRHKPTNQAIVVLDRRTYYLGAWQSDESKREYERLIAEWLAAGRQLPPRGVRSLSVSELCRAYLVYANGYYVKNGVPTGQLWRVTTALLIAEELYGSKRCTEFGPLALKACRQVMIGRGWARSTINDCTECLRSAFRWGVAEEMIPSEVHEALRTVQGLRAGRVQGVKENGRVLPVPEAWIEPTLAHTQPAVAAMARLQRLTAMRPGEVCSMRMRDLTMTGRVELAPGHTIDLGPSLWIYRPTSWKTEHVEGARGQGDVILIGPQAQEILRPWLRTDLDGHLFQPREVMREHRRRQRAARKTTVQPSQLDRSVRNPERQPGERYDHRSYAHAIKRACRREMITRTRGEGLKVRERVAQLRHWHPHQLRHNGATAIAEEFGIEVARVVLRHRHIRTTTLYAEPSLRAAAAAILRMG